MNLRSVSRWLAAQIQNCIKNFIEKVLPRVGEIKPDQEFQIATPEQGGDVEHFFYEGVKIYSIPDYAYKIGDEVHIHDWKAGKTPQGFAWHGTDKASKNG